MNIKLWLFTILLLDFQTTEAQPAIEWMNLFDAGRADSEIFNDVFANDAGGYTLCGGTGTRWWMMKTNDRGRELWSRYYDSIYRAYLNTVIECDNGDLLTAGVDGGQNFTAMLTNSAGEPIWVNRLVHGMCQSVIELKQGGFVLTGGDYVFMLSHDGEEIWRRHFEDGAIRQLYGTRQCEDGIVVSGTYRAQGETSRYWAVKFSLQGEIEWNRLYDLDQDVQAGRDLVSCSDGGFLVGGWVDNTNGRDTPFFGFQRIAINGDPSWRSVLGGEQGERYHYMFGSLLRIRDAGYAAVGWRAPSGTYRAAQPVFYSLDLNGNIVWHEYYPFDTDIRFGRNYNSFTSVIMGHDGSLIAVGTICNSEGDRGQDGLMLKLLPDVEGPIILEHMPEDTILTALQDDTIRFSLHAVNRLGEEQGLEYDWLVDDSLVEHGRSAVIELNSLGLSVVEGRVRLADFTASARWHVTVTDLYVFSHSPDTLSLSRRRGTSQTFSLDSVAAVAGDPVQYQWTLTNLNNFEREDAGMETGATVQFLQSGNYQMEGLAYRGESSDNVIWTIQVRSAILDFWPRELSLSVLADSLVSFGVLPFNPGSDSLSYAWYLNNDLIGLDSTVQWRFAPGERGDSTSYNFSVIVMDGSEGDTVRWTVNVHPPEGVGKWTSGQVDKWGILSISPNPFNNSTTIRFTVPSSSSSSSAQSASSAVNLSLHDLTGREVQQLVNSPLSAGQHAVALNGADLPAGVYLVRLETTTGVRIRKVVLVR